MKALQLESIHQWPTYKEVATPTPESDQVLVSIKAAALNHRDVWITHGKYPKIKLPCILGSDGAGLVGDREVIINPNINWGDNPDYQRPDYRILGLPDDGTFAEYCVVGKDKIHDKPAHLSFEEAAALPLGGLTAFRSAFTKAKIKEGDRVLISGVGGGVALLACQFALAAGAHVWVTSGSEEKIESAIQMGATGGASYKEEGWADQLKLRSGGFDAVIDSAAGDGFHYLAKVCRPGARIAIYGGTQGMITKLNPFNLFWKQVALMGTTMGTDAEFAQMIDFVGAHKITPVVDEVFSFENAEAAFVKMDEGRQFGKIVMT